MPYTPSYTPYQQNYQNGSYYMPSYGQAPAAPYQMPQNSGGIVWVDGEVGAKAFQLPPSWPVNTPFCMWDRNDSIIYLKTINQMGMPSPLQKIHYSMEESSQPALLQGQSGTGHEYVTREEFNQLRSEMMNRSNNGTNGGQ